MKRNFLSFAILTSALTIVACNNSGSGSNSGDSTNSALGSGDSSTATTPDASNNNTSSTPLSKDDSMFVMEAAVGGMTEVESGKVAQDNAASQRVKDFGAMMVRDHEKANQELMSFASGRGISLPTSLPADKQKHVDDMKNMKGKAFDSHYIGMMATDHQKTIDMFEKQASSGTNPELKTWASNTLPVLKMHKDSVDAIKKGMK